MTILQGRHPPQAPDIARPATIIGFVIADDVAYAEHVADGFVYTDQTVTSLHRLFDVTVNTFRRFL